MLTTRDTGYCTPANVRFLELAEAGQIQRESVTMDRDGNFVAMTHTQWEAAGHCPDWCRAVHNNANECDRREHAGEVFDVPLAIDDAATCEAFGAPIAAQMLTNHHRAEPFIQVDVDSPRKWVDMTLDEAEDLALWLLAAVKAGRRNAAKAEQ